MPFYQFVPDLLARCATEVLDNGACDVEHDVRPQREVAGPPETVAGAEGNEEVRPFEEDGGFEYHDDDAVEDVIVVDVLIMVNDGIGRAYWTE